MVTIKQIEALYWIVTLGSFEAAARKLNTSQAAISKRIRDLEEVFDTPMFDRSRRSAKVTEKGTQLLSVGVDMLRLRDELVSRVKDDEEPVRRFSFGVTEFIALTWLPRFVLRLRQSYPRTVLVPRVDNAPKLHELFNAGHIDFILVPRTRHSIYTKPVLLGELHREWMCRPELIPPAQTMLLEDLVTYPILTLDPLLGIGGITAEWLSSQRVTARKVVPSNSVVALSGLAVAGLGIAHLPVPYFSHLIETGLLRTVQTIPPLPSVPYVAIYHEGDSPGFHNSVAEIAKQCCDFTSLAYDI